jgi:hypothetical protein
MTPPPAWEAIFMTPPSTRPLAWEAVLVTPPSTRPEVARTIRSSRADRNSPAARDR